MYYKKKRFGYRKRRMSATKRAYLAGLRAGRKSRFRRRRRY